MLQWMAVALGGAVGAMMRFGISTYMLPVVPGKFPWATFFVNVLGSFLIGVLYTIIVEKSLWSPQWKILLMTGFLGALTTFSTFSIETVHLYLRGQMLLASAYAVITMAGCFIASACGLTLTARWV
ncbi:fluoride efflux transporter CrcB [Sessilibacter corallicola]|uniref:fluoride efflux transporter CrcB n=1 Tax=Sessilibacter corallicola TaxID=2904075 RepID=UPI001E4F72BF|nr:fluoride efflux transporter CrcB [Sessilibacter corallicola]MCE2030266.1 fluoride efflux transporter CrcB [Sessilibacter corallicola]